MANVAGLTNELYVRLEQWDLLARVGSLAGSRPSPPLLASPIQRGERSAPGRSSSSGDFEFESQLEVKKWGSKMAAFLFFSFYSSYLLSPRRGEEDAESANSEATASLCSPSDHDVFKAESTPCRTGPTGTTCQSVCSW